MVEKGYWPDVVTYGTMVNGLCKTGAAMGMLRKMEGGGCKPDRVVYSVIIDRLCIDGLLIEGWSLLLEMIEGFITEQRCVIELMIQRGVMPNVVTYSILMDEFCMRDQMDEVYSKRLVPDTVTYNTLICGCVPLRVLKLCKSFLMRCKLMDSFQISLLTLHCWIHYAETKILLRQ
ncbi:pentatricopeptide repeat-containing protein At3g22470, mitochondrial-like [Quercus suber]|uniref:pentatricopeptide repeat-containing protein At3g22470, mitochondrial-like n=1 Tax=Quercus suber TaxID=58331 RepID=UPI0032E02A74